MSFVKIIRHIFQLRLDNSEAENTQKEERSDGNSAVLQTDTTDGVERK